MTVTAANIEVEDGPRNTVWHCYAMVSAGDSEYRAQKVLIANSQNLYVAGPACTRYSLERIQYSTVNVAVKIDWEGTGGLDTHVITLPANKSDTMNFLKHSGPIQNLNANKTGNVVFTTIPGDPDAASPADGHYDVWLWLRKKYT